MKEPRIVVDKSLSPEYWAQFNKANQIDPNQAVNVNAFIYLFMFIGKFGDLIFSKNCPGLLLFFKGAMTWCRFRHLQAPIRPASERVIQREV